MTTGFGFCPNCGTPLVSAGQKFCIGCGYAFSSAVPPAPPAASAAPPAPVVIAPPPPPIVPPAPIDWTAPMPPEPIVPPEPLDWAVPPEPESETEDVTQGPFESPEPEPAMAAEEPAAPPPWATFVPQPPPPPVAQPAAQPVAPPPWAMPAAGEPAALPSAPAPQPTPPVAPPFPPAYPGAPAAGYPSAPIPTAAGRKVAPKLLAIGGIALAAIVAVAVYMNMSAKSGSITLTPSSFSCSSSAVVITVMHLPSSMQATDMLIYQADGVTKSTDTVDGAFSRQSDGTWLVSVPSTASSICQGSSGSATSATHTLRILDASGKVLAEGSYTLTP